VIGETALEAWLRQRTAQEAEAALLGAGVAAAALASSVDLAASEHLRERGFWQDGLPGLPWRASFGRRTGEAPGLGADTDAVLAEVLGYSRSEIATLRDGGALG
jgi:crotonobetainyl-CoA:carnitine CoA-transferase CaiB-like acyl-CoA transferase